MQKTLASVFLMGLLSATLCAIQADKGTKSASKALDKTTIEAWISDEKCGANIDADCAKKCQEQGAKLVVVNVTDKSIMPVANQDTIRGFIGQHVIVTGTVKGTLTIASVKPTKKSQ
jgi:maltose-binding protein MalE